MPPSGFIQRPYRWPIAIILIVFAGVFTAAWMYRNRSRGNDDPELTTPLLAIRSIHSQSLFFTPYARPFLAAIRPELIPADDRDPQSDRACQEAAAVQNPPLWRRLDRQYRFDTILLSGEPSQFRPLLKHLLESGDWVLTYLDHTSMIFKLAPARAWTPQDLDPLRRKFASQPRAGQVDFLVQASSRLLNAGQIDLATHFAADALALDSASAPAWTQRGACDAMAGKWPEALTAAERALRIDTAFQPALSTKAQALLALNRAGEAFDASQRLVEMNPTDPFLLYQHARISHAAHAYQSETEALKSLIGIADAAHQSACGYHIYLAQAYVAQGDAEPSLDEFHKALADPAITPEQREYVEKSIDTINSKTGR